MTNPSDAVGTNGAYGGRTSVDALNDVLGAFDGSGVLCGWVVRADSGMSVLVGGQSGSRDVAIAQDQLGDKTTVNNRLGSPISVTIAAASPSSTRVDSIVLYVNKPATVLTTTIDNPEACGIIAVQGTTTAPSSADIRSAITADGGTGATAYYVVIADITIPASATVITNTNITNYSGKLLGSGMIADSAITAGKIADGAVKTSKIDWTQMQYVDPSNFITLNAGYSFFVSGTSPHNWIMKFGNIIMATLVIEATNAFTTANTVIGTLNATYRPSIVWNGDCAFGTAFAVGDTGYFYFNGYSGSTQGNVTVATTSSSTYKYLKIKLFYML